MKKHNIKKKSSIDLDKIQQASWPHQTDKKPYKQVKKKYRKLAFFNLVLGIFLSVNFALGSFAPDISLLLLCLVLILSFYTKYPFNF